MNIAFRMIRANCLLIYLLAIINIVKRISIIRDFCGDFRA